MRKYFFIFIGSVFFVYVAFYLSALFTSMTFTDWIRLSYPADSDISTVQSIMDSLLYIPIYAFTLHVLFMILLWFLASRKNIK